MNDTYVECLVARKPNPLNILIKAGCIAVCAIFVLASLMFGISVLIFGAIIAGFASAYLVFPMLDIEYEYLYLDKELTIDKIMSKQKRKKMETLDLLKMELFAPADGHDFDSYLSRKVTVKDYSSGFPEHKAYYLAYHDEKGEALYKLEPDEALLNVMRNMAPRKVRM